MVAPGVAEQVRPGHFVALSVGGDNSSMLLRRAFSVYRTQDRGVYGGTVEIVFSAAGQRHPMDVWAAQSRRRSMSSARLGRPFALPKEPVMCTLVGGGYGSAPLFTLAEQLRERGCGVNVVLGASTEARLFGVLEGKRMSQSVAVVTEDGSLGEVGRVTDVLPGLLERTGSEVVYACGPMGMLAAVSEWPDTSVRTASARSRSPWRAASECA